MLRVPGAATARSRSEAAAAAPLSAMPLEYVNPGTDLVTGQEAVARHRDWFGAEYPGDAFAEVFDTAVRRRVASGLP